MFAFSPVSICRGSQFSVPGQVPQENEEARSVKAGFSLQDLSRERRYAKRGHLLPMFPIEQAMEPGVSALPLC
jgi:hypothetical protein